jgi:hypothetical protein
MRMFDGTSTSAEHTAYAHSRRGDLGPDESTNSETLDFIVVNNASTKFVRERRDPSEAGLLE